MEASHHDHPVLVELPGEQERVVADLLGHEAVVAFNRRHKLRQDQQRLRTSVPNIINVFVRILIARNSDKI